MNIINIYPVKINRLAYAFELPATGTLYNFVFNSRSAHYNYANNYYVPPPAPSELLHSIHLCIDNTPIVSLHDTAKHTVPHYITCSTPVYFFRDNMPLFTDDINSKNICVVVEFKDEPMGSVWLSCTEKKLSSFFPIHTTNGFPIQYKLGKIIVDQSTKCNSCRCGI
uniref:Uncharacterized protein n=1 Tax=viral metagenome TaxID=1070528 RepID=A0A6C0J5C5_9ZZZZ